MNQNEAKAVMRPMFNILASKQPRPRQIPKLTSYKKNMIKLTPIHISFWAFWDLKRQNWVIIAKVIHFSLQRPKKLNQNEAKAVMRPMFNILASKQPRPRQIPKLTSYKKNMIKLTPIHISFWAFWDPKRQNRPINDKVNNFGLETASASPDS